MIAQNTILIFDWIFKNQSENDKRISLSRSETGFCVQLYSAAVYRSVHIYLAWIKLGGLQSRKEIYDDKNEQKI